MEWYQTLIATAVGAGLAAGVGELNRRAARKDEWLNTRRSKLEEVFSELANSEAQAARIAVATLQKRQGMEAEPLVPLELTRLTALLALYFPEARQVLEDHRKRLEASRRARMQELGAAAKNLDYKAIENNTLIMVMELNEEVGRFGKELRPVLDAIAQKLAR